MNEHEKLKEECRLVFRTIGILNTLEKCVSNLKNGFLNTNDFEETRKTINRLHLEILQVDSDTREMLDKCREKTSD
jgi:hypothetical protein